MPNCRTTVANSDLKDGDDYYQYLIEYYATTSMNAEEIHQLGLAEVNNQIDRYITWPAKALSYKIGEIKIRELRKMAENKLGSKFDIRTFHDQMLANGNLPLDMLEEFTNDWVNKQLVAHKM